MTYKIKSFAKGEEKLQKIIVPLEKELHKRIKIYCIENEINMHEFAQSAILEKSIKLNII